MAILKRRTAGGLAIVIALALSAASAGAARIKDLVDVEGVRSNPLSGYGIVVGLQGTGDGQQSLFTVQSILSMLRRRGVQISVDPSQVRVKNAAAVMVTAQLSPFARAGGRIDVELSSIGDAKSLRGGTLILSPLYGGDQQVYAVAQGPVSLGGGFAASAAGASTTSGHPTVGIIPAGAIVEREVAVDLAANGKLKLGLRQSDFTTAGRIAMAINQLFHDRPAKAVDPGTIELTLPGGSVDAMAMLPQIEALEVSPDRRARIIVNERTGTVIMGEDVKVSPVAVAHGSLQVAVKTELEVSQPLPFSPRGETVVVPDSQIEVKEGDKRSLAVLQAGVNLGELVRGLNALGVTPQDLVAVLQAIKAAGALDAELEVM